MLVVDNTQNGGTFMHDRKTYGSLASPTKEYFILMKRNVEME